VATWSGPAWLHATTARSLAGGAGAVFRALVLPRRRRELDLHRPQRARGGRGVGHALLRRLCQEADAAQIWTIQAGILAANEASIKLHTACGFRLVGVREKLARKRGRWSDVVLMERRSPFAG